MIILRDYTCEACGGKYKSARPEKQTLKEFEELFPHLKDENKVSVCENCFIKIMEDMEPGKYRYVKYIDKH